MRIALWLLLTIMITSQVMAQEITHVDYNTNIYHHGNGTHTWVQGGNIRNYPQYRNSTTFKPLKDVVRVNMLGGNTIISKYGNTMISMDFQDKWGNRRSYNDVKRGYANFQVIMEKYDTNEEINFGYRLENIPPTITMRNLDQIRLNLPHKINYQIIEQCEERCINVPIIDLGDNLILHFYKEQLNGMQINIHENTIIISNFTGFVIDPTITISSNLLTNDNALSSINPTKNYGQARGADVGGLWTAGNYGRELLAINHDEAFANISRVYEIVNSSIRVYTRTNWIALPRDLTIINLYQKFGEGTGGNAGYILNSTQGFGQSNMHAFSWLNTSRQNDGNWSEYGANKTELGCALYNESCYDNSDLGWQLATMTVTAVGQYNTFYDTNLTNYYKYMWMTNRSWQYGFRIHNQDEGTLNSRIRIDQDFGLNVFKPQLVITYTDFEIEWDGSSAYNYSGNISNQTLNITTENYFSITSNKWEIDGTNYSGSSLGQKCNNAPLSTTATQCHINYNFSLGNHSVITHMQKGANPSVWGWSHNNSIEILEIPEPPEQPDLYPNVTINAPEDGYTINTTIKWILNTTMWDDINLSKWYLYTNMNGSYEPYYLDKSWDETNNENTSMWDNNITTCDNYTAGTNYEYNFTKPNDIAFGKIQIRWSNQTRISCEGQFIGETHSSNNTLDTLDIPTTCLTDGRIDFDTELNSSDLNATICEATVWVGINKTINTTYANYSANIPIHTNYNYSFQYYVMVCDTNQSCNTSDTRTLNIVYADTTTDEGLTNEFIAIIAGMGLMMGLAYLREEKSYQLIAYTGMITLGISLFFIGDTVPFFMLTTSTIIYAGYNLATTVTA